MQAVLKLASTQSSLRSKVDIIASRRGRHSSLHADDYVRRILSDRAVHPLSLQRPHVVIKQSAAATNILALWDRTC